MRSGESAITSATATLVQGPLSEFDKMGDFPSITSFAQLEESLKSVPSLTGPGVAIPNPHRDTRLDINSGDDHGSERANGAWWFLTEVHGE